jgi:hypothetical protein
VEVEGSQFPREERLSYIEEKSYILVQRGDMFLLNPLSGRSSSTFVTDLAW